MQLISHIQWNLLYKMAIRICWYVGIHTQPPRPSEFTSAPSYRLPERTSPIVSHIAEILPDRVLYLHFWTINSLSSSVRRYLWNTGHGGSLSVVRTGGSRMTPNQCCTAGEESPSIPVSQVSHPWPKDVCVRAASPKTCDVIASDIFGFAPLRWSLDCTSTREFCCDALNLG